MAVVLLKIVEEAHLSGELKLSGRKLKDFPKAAAKYNLSDTVIAGKQSKKRKKIFFFFIYLVSWARRILNVYFTIKAYDSSRLWNDNNAQNVQHLSLSAAASWIIKFVQTKEK